MSNRIGITMYDKYGDYYSNSFESVEPYDTTLDD